MHPLTPYKGSERKLVLAFDVGTTYSGISYCILEPGQVPEVKGITKFPAQDLVHGSSKIPSVIYYDKAGAIRAIGAETLGAEVFEMAHDQGWTKVEWFKLLLGFADVKSSELSVTSYISTLPAEKSAVDVLGDYLGYLLQCSREFIQESMPSGTTLWRSLQRSGIHFVLSHPNAWEGRQQANMRKAAIAAKMISKRPKNPATLSFVSEGEASLHFAISHCLPLGSVSENSGVIVVDAGGGTIDMSAYRQVPLVWDVKYEEIAIRRCHLEGSIFVNCRLDALLRGDAKFRPVLLEVLLIRIPVLHTERLKGSKFADDIPFIISCFDKDTKLRFKRTEVPQYIKFGSPKDNDEKYNIRHGQLRLSGRDIARCIEPSISCIVGCIKDMLQDAAASTDVKIKRVILVGGFAANDWLYHRLSEDMCVYGVEVTRPSFYVSKAVADGAIHFFLENRVQQRISTTTLGAQLWTKYVPSDIEHKSRENEVLTYSDGTQRLLAFRTLLRKGDVISRKHKIWKSCKASYAHSQDAWETVFTFLSFSGDPPATGRHIWMDGDASFCQLATIKADLRHLKDVAEKNEGPQGLYSDVFFEILLTLSDTEIKAEIVWEEQGIRKRIDADLVYNEATRQAWGK